MKTARIVHTANTNPSGALESRRNLLKIGPPSWRKGQIGCVCLRHGAVEARARVQLVGHARRLDTPRHTRPSVECVLQLADLSGQRPRPGRRHACDHKQSFKENPSITSNGGLLVNLRETTSSSTGALEPGIDRKTQPMPCSESWNLTFVFPALLVRTSSAFSSSPGLR